MVRTLYFYLFLQSFLQPGFANLQAAIPSSAITHEGGASPCRRSQQNKTVQCQAQIMFPVKLNPERKSRKNIRKSGNTRKEEKAKKAYRLRREMDLALFPNLRTYCSFFRLVRFLFFLSEAIFEALDLFLDSSERLGLPTGFFPLSPTPSVATR